MEQTAADVVGYRITAQQLDRPPAERPLTEAAILDLGIQDTGRDAASWALVNRGVPVPGPGALAADDELAVVWSLRASPHYYRRADLLDVLVAISPFSEADARKRVISADQALRKADITAREGLAEVARQMRRIVTTPTVKGEVSTRLTAVLDEPYLRYCVPCQATHVWETLFRLGALYGGLELEPGTSPPVLRRIPDWPRRPAGPAADPSAAPERLQLIRNYLRFLGPAAPRDVAGFLDAPLADVKSHWPEDAVAVQLDGKQVWSLSDVTKAAVDPELTRLLGPFDLLLQGKDRSVLVPDSSHHKALWPTIGRPGAVLSGTELVGTWRPQASGRTFTLRVQPWTTLPRALQQRIEEQAVGLADHRGLAFAGVTME